MLDTLIRRPRLRPRPASPLHTRHWGTGNRVAVLVHGMMSDSAAWWQVGPALARRGYRVVAVDLPGHGGSPSRADADMGFFVDMLTASVPRRPELVLGHSMGAFVTAAALPRLRP